MTRLRRLLTGEAAQFVAISCGAALMLALSGAFISPGVGLGRRLAYWLPLMLIGAVCGEAGSRLVGRWIDLEERPWLGVVLITLLISLVITPVVWLATGLFDGGLYPLSHLPRFFAPVVTVCAAITCINVLASRTPRQTHVAPDHSPSRFLQRLPHRLRGGAIHAVQAEDHYLRIHTDRGSDLILMRLSDALGELAGLEGAQTHRSWWVARDAVEGVRRGDGRARLTLKGGVEAPVSRRYARALRAAGWY